MPTDALLQKGTTGDSKLAKKPFRALQPTYVHSLPLSMSTRGGPCLQSLCSCLTSGQTKALVDLATAGCALLRLCLPEEVVEVSTFSHVLHFPLPEAALANGSSEQEDEVEHSQEEDALEDGGPSDNEGLENEGGLGESLTGEEELSLCSGDTGLQLQGKAVSSGRKAQAVGSACCVAAQPELSEESPEELHVWQEPGRDACRAGRAAVYEGDGLLFVKNQPPLLTTEDSERPEPGAPGLEGRTVPEEEEEGDSVSGLSLLPPSSDNSDTCLSHKTSPALSASSSSSAMHGKDADLAQFDCFFPELGNGCFCLGAVVSETGSGHSSHRVEGEEVLTVDSVSTTEVLTADADSQLSLSSAEDAGSKQEVECLHEGVCTFDFRLSAL